MSNPLKISDDVLDAAIDWLVILHSGDMSDQQRQQFEQWKLEKKEHALAIQHIGKFSQGLTDLSDNFSSEVLVQSKQDFNLTAKRNLLFSLAGLVLIGCSVYVMPWGKWQSDHHTAIGEIQSITLEDGSQLILASNSYVDVDYSQHRRQIKLIDGEIYIQTAKDPQHRPFIVKTKNGAIQALGTQFTVHQASNRPTKVKVYQHAVAIQPHHNATPSILRQGQRATFNEEEVSKPLVIKNDQPYWTQHLLVVEQWSLEKVLEELYRYKQGTYWIDPALKNIQVSGVFSLKNPQQSLETLAYTHQLQLHYYSPYLLEIKKR